MLWTYGDNRIGSTDGLIVVERITERISFDASRNVELQAGMSYTVRTEYSEKLKKTLLISK